MNDKYLKEFTEEGLHFARCLGSKSGYYKAHPKSFVIFNCRVYTEADYLSNISKIKDFFKGMEDELWYGDLDFATEDIIKLRRIANKIGSIYITTEHGTLVLVIGGN